MDEGLVRAQLASTVAALYIGSEGGFVSPSEPTVLPGPLLADQMLELSRLSYGDALRTDLNFDYRMDYRDEGSLNALMFLLPTGTWPDFLKTTHDIESQFCAYPRIGVDFILAGFDGPERQNKLKVCQALASPDPSNLLEAVLRVNAATGRAEIAERTGNILNFVDYAKANEVVASHETSMYAEVFPGDFFLTIRNPSLGSVPFEMGRVSAGQSVFQSFYREPRNWKALTTTDDEEYLLTSGDFGMWICKSNFRQPVGMGPSFSAAEVDRNCQRQRLPILNISDLVQAFAKLQSKYITEIGRLALEVQNKEAEKLQIQRRIEAGSQRTSILRARIADLSKALHDNLYFKIEREEGELKGRYIQIAPRIAEIESLAVLELHHLQDRIDESERILWSEVPVFVLFGLPIVFITIPLYVYFGIPMAFGGFAAAGMLFGPPALGGLHAVLQEASFLTKMKPQAALLKSCITNLDNCPAELDLNFPWLKERKDLQAEARRIEARLVEIAKIKLSPEYLAAKNSPLFDEIKRLELEIQREQQQILVWEQDIQAVDHQISLTQAQRLDVAKKLWNSTSLRVAAEESYADPKIRIVRSTGLKTAEMRELLADM